MTGDEEGIIKGELPRERAVYISAKKSFFDLFIDSFSRSVRHTIITPASARSKQCRACSRAPGPNCCLCMKI